MRNRRQLEPDGFTLVEVLVASLVMLIAVFGLMSTVPQCYEQTRNSGRMSTLNHLAAETLEELLSRGYDDSALTMGIHPAQSFDSDGERYYPVAGFDEAFSVRWIVAAGPTDASGTAVSGIKSIVVEATFGTRYDSSGTAQTTPRSLLSQSRTLIAQ